MRIQINLILIFLIITYIDLFSQKSQDSLTFEVVFFNLGDSLIIKKTFHNKILSYEAVMDLDSNIRSEAAYYNNNEIKYQLEYDSKNELIKTIFFQKDNIPYIMSNRITDSTTLYSYFYSNGNLHLKGMSKIDNNLNIDLSQSTGNNARRFGIWTEYFNTGEVMSKGAYWPFPGYFDKIDPKSPGVIDKIEVYLKHGIWINYHINGQIDSYTCWDRGEMINCP